MNIVIEKKNDKFFAKLNMPKLLSLNEDVTDQIEDLLWNPLLIEEIINRVERLDFVINQIGHTIGRPAAHRSEPTPGEIALKEFIDKYRKDPRHKRALELALQTAKINDQIKSEKRRQQWIEERKKLFPPHEPTNYEDE